MSDGTATRANASASSETAPKAGTAAPQAQSTTESAPKDVVLLGPPTKDGAGLHVLRARDERIELGELRALQEGRPITGEIVTLAPREGNPHICDVKESFAPPSQAKGPAKVATSAYRQGWDDIFGTKSSPSDPTRQLN
jgi:hypothetical protein